MFVIRYGCSIVFDRFFLFVGLGYVGIVLIRREMDRVILLVLVIGGDKVEYYFEVVFCERFFFSFY